MTSTRLCRKAFQQFIQIGLHKLRLLAKVIVFSTAAKRNLWDREVDTMWIMLYDRLTLAIILYDPCGKWLNEVELGVRTSTFILWCKYNFLRNPLGHSSRFIHAQIKISHLQRFRMMLSLWVIVVYSTRRVCVAYRTIPRHDRGRLDLRTCRSGRIRIIWTDNDTRRCSVVVVMSRWKRDFRRW